jgi:hypothetical protein
MVFQPLDLFSSEHVGGPIFNGNGFCKHVGLENQPFSEYADQQYDVGMSANVSKSPFHPSAKHLISQLQRQKLEYSQF